MADKTMEKVYKTPEYIRKCVYAYKERHKERLTEEYLLKKNDPECKKQRADYMKEYRKKKKLKEQQLAASS